MSRDLRACTEKWFPKISGTFFGGLHKKYQSFLVTVLESPPPPVWETTKHTEAEALQISVQLFLTGSLTTVGFSKYGIRAKFGDSLLYAPTTENTGRRGISDTWM